MTSLIRSNVPASSPFTTESTSASGAMCGATRATTERRCRDGVAKITRSAVAMSAGSADAMRSSGSSTPGSRRSFRCVLEISAAVSALWHSRTTGSRFATMAARVVPHAPAPTTATRGSGISATGGSGPRSAVGRS